ncbi:TonB-dependent receptor plug domain-containing protein [Myroides sp. BIT-d1]|uniref:TonB-dependent receptor plug domain-containing protein n=1 Tax=Myroides albus TaxID=2562892 RepID=A0A6I3LN54_9FLAO|nr:TonB-dependent receptor [Myroides albus]MTG98021.1 TonB-dependent receptor plug domain-containing protein [Myroides albus]
MKTYWTITFAVISVLFHLNLHAQTAVGSIKGVVLDENSLPAIGATVMIDKTTTGTATNEQGEFVLQSNLGSTTITVNYIGYKPYSKTIAVKEGTQSLRIKLEQDLAVLNDVVITAKSKVTSLKEEAFTVNAIDMKQLANSTMDLNQILNKTSGIKIRQQGGVGSDYNFSINGMSGKAVKFFIDGVPLEMLGKGVDMNSLPINMAQRVEIFKGVVPVHLSTDAMGGAVNIISNGTSKDYLDASYTIGSFNTHKVNLNGQLKDQKTGLIMRVNTFLNKSDNDYKMKDMKIWNTNTNAFELKDVKRFNDEYQSLFVMGEFGIEDKSWADQLFVGVSHSLFDKNIQTGADQEVVYGKLKQDGDANNYFVKYKKANLLNDKLDINFYTGYSKSLETSTDTVLRKYSWDGSYVPSATSELGGYQINKKHEDRLYSQLTTTYRIAENHKFTANYTFDYLKNTSYNTLVNKKSDITPSKMTKQILSLAYQQDFFDKRWSNIFFAKYYKVDLEKLVFNRETRLDEKVKEPYDNWGYGIASTFKITDKLGVKASYEHSYRLVEPDEIFGDGVSVTANMELKPETSNNYNLGFYYSNNFADHFVRAEVAGYIRDTKDFIYTVQNLHNSTFKYENLTNILTKGIEGEVNYQYKDLIRVMMNITYNYAYNNTKYANNSNDVVSATYKKEVPNQPWLFGNVDVSIGQNNIIQEGSRLEFHYGLQMTEWYYKNWQSYGNKRNIPTIPRQTLHNVGVSYSMQNGKYNFALDCTNIGDALAYDNFKLQKQGRAFYFKFRYALK